MKAVIKPNTPDTMATKYQLKVIELVTKVTAQSNKATIGAQIINDTTPHIAPRNIPNTM